MQASLVIAHNVFNQNSYQATAIRSRRRISTLAPETQKPFICIYNGEPLLRKDWQRTTVKDADVLVFIICPPQGGGGGSNPLQIVLMIGLAAASGGLSTLITGATQGLAFGLVKAAIGIAGNALIGSLFGTPSLPKSQLNASLAAPSPTYSLNAQGNVSRIGDPIPVIYGTMKVFPNYAADPYTEYAGNEQYLYQLFCVGQGYYDIDGIYIYDTPIASFPEISYEVVQPGGTVTLFPTDVVSAGAVNGQELIGAVIGPFIANNAGTSTNALAIDIALSRGLYYANDQGGLDARTVTFRIEAQQINDAGAAVGAWTILQDVTITAATSTPQRYSYRYTVANGRYQVRLTRLSAKDTNSRVGNDINWVGLRAYLPGSQQYGNVTMVAMRMRASNSLTAQSSRKVNMVVTRKLPIWNGVAWSAPTRTRSIAWALADICRAKYGAGYADNRIDLAKLITLESTWAARGDTFNATYDSASVFWEALTNCAKAGRAKPYTQGGIVSFVRDEPRTLPVAMFNMRNITKGSVNVQYLMPTESTADCIELQFWNQDIWAWDYINCALPDSTSSTPAKVQIFGVTDRNQAYREGMYLCAVNKYRRTMVNLGSEMEGFIPSYGDLCAISHDRPQWGQSGELTNYDSATKTITCSEDLDWSESGTHYFAFRNRNGSVRAPIAATAGAATNQAVLATVLPFAPDYDYTRESTYYTFGVATSLYKRALLSGVKPRDLEHCDLSFVLDDDRVYSADGSVPPDPTPPSTLPVVITRPTLKDMVIAHDGTPENPVLIVSLTPSPDADHYLIDLSTDNQTWSRVADTSATTVRLNVPIGDVWLRACGVGLTQGAYIYSGKIVTGLIPPPQAPVLQLAETFTGTKVSIKWAKVLRAISTRIEIRGAGNLVRSLTTTQNTYEYTAEDAVKDGGPWRDLVITAYSIGATGESGGNSLTVSNPQMGELTGVTVYSGYKSGYVAYPKPIAPDFAGVQVHLSATNGFTPNANTLVYDGDSNIITLTADATATALVGGTTYYLRIGAYDTFGKDGINYGTNQYQFTALTAGVPSNKELLDSLNAALRDPTQANNLILTADRFALRYSNNGTPTDIYPFVLGQVNGQSVMGISADVIINGKVSANNLTSGTLAATENIIVGNGGMVLSGDGALTVYDGNSSVSNRDYVALTAGKLTFQRYRDGVYQTYKSVSHIEQGTANSGQTVDIPGYFDTQPKVQVSLNALKAFDYQYASQSQSWAVRADNLREITAGSRRWRFDAVAELNLSATSGTNTINASSGQNNSNTYNSPVSPVPPNTSQLTVRISVGSVRGNGANTNVWAYRSITWKVYHRASASAWVLKSTKTVAMGAQIANTVTDSVAIVGLSGANQEIYIEYTAQDAGGVFGLGGDVYSYAQNTVADNGSSGSTATNYGGGDFTNRYSALVMNGYAAPFGWEVYLVTYSYQYKAVLTQGFSGAGFARVLAPGLDYSATGGNWAYSFNNGWELNGPVSSISDSRVGYNSIVFNDSSYNPNAIYCRALVSGNGNVAQLIVANASAVIYLRQIQKNSATPVNNFTLTEITWQTATAVSLAVGSLNWLAIGD